MIKRESGFTLVELLVTMVVFVLVIAAASQIFTGLLTQFKQQSKIAETNIEGIVGLEILRHDIEHAGYGLPWTGLTLAYDEITANPFSLNDATGGVPRGILSVNVAGAWTYAAPNNIFNGSDYLVIKAINVAQNDTSQRSTTLTSAPFDLLFNPRVWSDANQNLGNTENVIVLALGGTAATMRSLVVQGGQFYTAFGNVTAAPWAPVDPSINYIVYGITPNGTLPRRPFNRADYFIRRFDGAGTNITPQRCAPNTGVLEKATVNHDATGTFNFTPLLDCVADMQVVYVLDMNDDGNISPTSRTISDADGTNIDTNEAASAGTVQTTFANAASLRQRLKEVRVYILSHEGQRDENYTFNNFTAGACATCIRVGDSATLGRDFDLLANIGANDYLRYRWRVYTMVVKVNNME